MEGWLYFLGFGAVAGWIANFIMRGRGIGLIGNIIVGIVGTFIGDWLFSKLGISIGLGSPFAESLVVSVAGAVVLLFVVGLVRR